MIFLLEGVFTCLLEDLEDDINCVFALSDDSVDITELVLFNLLLDLTLLYLSILSSSSRVSSFTSSSSSSYFYYLLKIKKID